mgnify:CR=1 FL=1
MHVTVIGNYKINGYDTHQSMHLYANFLTKVLKLNGHKVRLLNPKPILSRFDFKNDLINKYLRFIDSYFFFGLYLYFTIKKTEITHVCDQANSILIYFLKSKKKILTCHDLIYINRLENKRFKKLTFMGKIYRRLILTSIKKFDKIICDSSNTKKDLIKTINIKKSNIDVIFVGLNQNFYPMKISNRKKILSKYNINSNFFLHVGSNVWYKNKPKLLHIFSEFLKLRKNKDYKIVFAGEKINRELMNIVSKLRLNNSFINIVNPNSKTLCALYSDSNGLIFPSITEGFGWPIIEAQTCGCPVFSSRIEPMSELGAKSVFYINPKNIYESAKIIYSKLRLRKKIIKSGFQNQKRFSLSSISRQYKVFYNSL